MTTISSYRSLLNTKGLLLKVALLSVFVVLGCASNPPKSTEVMSLDLPVDELVTTLKTPESDVALRSSEIEFDQALQSLQNNDWMDAKRYLDLSIAELNRELSDTTLTIDTTAILDLNRRIIFAYSLIATKMPNLAEIVEDLPNGDYDVAPIDEFENIKTTPLDANQIKTISNWLDTLNLKQFSLPVELNERVLKEVQLLTNRTADFMRGSLNRKSLYEEMIMRKLAEYNMPQDLIFLSLVESGFKVRAYSSAKASGLWQFIPATGRRYGLKIDPWIDMRRNPESATDAAFRYLGDLYKEFKDWNMAMASYNCGEGRVRRQKRELGEGATFWDMKLPKETMHYVPRILAATIIGRHPHLFGFKPEVLEKVSFDTISVFHPIPLSLVAQVVDVSEELIRDLNIELLRGVTPPTMESYVLKLPQGTYDVFAEAYANMDKSQFKTWQEHRVKKKETLSTIARKYGISVKELQSVNSLKNKKLKIGQILTIPTFGSTKTNTEATTKSSEENTSEPIKSSNKTKAKKHTVKSGENLSAISRKYGVSVQALRDMNNLEDDKLRIGMSLRITPKEVTNDQSSEESAPANKTLKIATESYQIKDGDTYYSLSQKLGVSLNDLMTINDARDGKLSLGQVILIPKKNQESNTTTQTKKTSTTSSKKGTHTVKSGDNLSDIAEKYSVTVEQLQAWNGLKKRTSLKVGEELIVKQPVKNNKLTKAKGKTYTIRNGDSLWDIARRHGVSVQNLKDWNPGIGSSLKPGDKIIVGK